MERLIILSYLVKETVCRDKHNLLLLSWTSCNACRKCSGKSELSEFTLFELKDLLRSLLSLKFKI